MKKYLLIVSFSVLSILASTAQSLPPVAQALYDEAYAHDSAQVIFALSHGATVTSTPDSNSYYVQWFPAGTPSAMPVIVTLHGSNGYAFAEFYNWYSYAAARGWGLIALQWYRGTASAFPNDYFTDTVLYRDIDTAFTRISYPSGKAFLHGFSRGAARSYALAFLDGHGGGNYFCTILSNAGAATSTYPLYAAINSGIYGPDVFAGKQWALYCGGLDTAYTISGCPAMSDSKTWLDTQAATVGIFIQDAALGHGDFHTVPAYMDSVLDYYSTCYNGTLATEHLKTRSVEVFPNPFRDNISISVQQGDGMPHTFIVRDMPGMVLFSETDVNQSAYTKMLSLNFLAPGVYVLEIQSGGRAEKRLIVKK